ncbi:MAG: glycosyltransferase family 2 protein [Candidatus Pacebacteria bacterium]|nr:glycosyltransferase family 2 protein [Candidatus Paceibacterota bacterium]
MKHYFSLILPAYNEEQGVEKIIPAVPVKEIRARGFETEIVVVDNNSTDKTAEVARRLGARVLREKNQGYGYAIKRGLNDSRGEIMVVCDADGTYPVEEIPRLLDYSLKGKLEFLVADRFGSNYLFLKTMQLVKRIGNLLLTWHFRLIYKVRLNDSLSGMFLIQRNLWQKLKVRSNQYFFSHEIKIEAIHYLKCRWGQMKISYDQRLGKSKLRAFQDGWQYLTLAVRKRLIR